MRRVPRTSPQCIRRMAPGILAILLLNCGGSRWLDEPVAYPPSRGTSEGSDSRDKAAPVSLYQELEGRAIRDEVENEEPEQATAAGAEGANYQGKLLGTFRNTYYDFPAEKDFSGPTVTLRDAACRPIQEIPRSFFEALCVQGSGTLRDGATVSFTKRDCECAEICPRTQQRICFDRLDPTQYPWGRGATGKPITPLLTVAVDTEMIPLGSALYIPEYEGIPRDAERTALHDGCFIAQDRGLQVKGKQVDIFTGHPAVTQLWNQRVPTGRGVRVVIDEPKCARAVMIAEPTGELDNAPTPARKSTRRRLKD